MYHPNAQRSFLKYVDTDTLKKTVTLLFAFFIIAKSQAQVAIGIPTPDPSAMLHVQATDKGMLVPRMTDVERIAIASPAEGLLVYQTNNAIGFWYYSTGQWRNLSSLNNGGLHTIYLTDDITDAQAVAKIATEYGPNTQEIRITRCYNLTTVDLSMVTKLAEVYIMGNSALVSVNLSGLQSLDGGIYIEQCPLLTSMPAQQIQKIGQSAYNGYGISVNNSGITSMNFPSLTVLGGSIDIQYNNALTAVNIPLVTQHGFPNSLPITISNNYALTSVSFATLQSSKDLVMSYNHSLTTINFPVLSTVKDLTVSYMGSLTTLSLPALTTANFIRIGYDTSLITLNAASLTNTAGMLFLSYNDALTSVSFPALTNVGLFSLYFCTAIPTLTLPALVSTCLTISNNTLLASVSLPALTTLTSGTPTIGSHCYINYNANLSSIQMDNFSSFTGISPMFQQNKLPSSNVNYLLAKLVALVPTLTMRSIQLSQSPAAPPTGQGLIDKATLIANGNMVDTN
jgi:hypothetical protein